MSIIRLMGGIPHRIRLAFKVEIWKDNNWISIKVLLDSGAERNFITQMFVSKWNLKPSE